MTEDALTLYAKVATNFQKNDDICNINNRRLIVFCDWPLTQWDVEMTLQNGGFDVLGLWASHKSMGRDAIVEEFNGDESNVQILVTGLKISALAINFQRNCSDAVFVDVPGNKQTALQAGGRILWLGQKRMCRMWVLTLDHNYNQVIQNRSTLKYVGIIAAQSKGQCDSKADLDAWAEAHQVTLAPDNNEQLQKAKHEITTLKAAHVDMELDSAFARAPEIYMLCT